MIGLYKSTLSTPALCTLLSGVTTAGKQITVEAAVQPFEQAICIVVIGEDCRKTVIVS